MSNRVFVIDKNKNPLMPCHPARARDLLKKQKAAVYRTYPFTIILKEREVGDVQPVAVKIDPGSKTTGLAVVSNQGAGKTVVFAAELEHRGEWIKSRINSRVMIRRSRRRRKTRYRQPRFLNRRQEKGWIPPSLGSRIANITTWVAKFRKFCPISSISMELVKFDMQKMENPEISGAEYQQGTLQGYEVREYLLEKWGRKCCYCGKADVPLQIEHIQADSNGGTSRICNLGLACGPCNQRKGNKPIEEFLKGKPELLAKIKRQLKTPLKDAAAVNVTRWALVNHLKETGLTVEIGSGGRTKFNRTSQGYPKSHWIDAACIGKSGELVRIGNIRPLAIKAMGHGNRQVCGVDKHGFPHRHRSRIRRIHGFQTGDIVYADVAHGKHMGYHCGRVTVRYNGQFRINGADVNYKNIKLCHSHDGYEY